MTLIFSGICEKINIIYWVVTRYHWRNPESVTVVLWSLGEGSFLCSMLCLLLCATFNDSLSDRSPPEPPGTAPSLYMMFVTLWVPVRNRHRWSSCRAGHYSPYFHVLYTPLTHKAVGGLLGFAESWGNSSTSCIIVNNYMRLLGMVLHESSSAPSH